MGVYLRPSWLLFPPLLAGWLCLFPTAHCSLPTAHRIVTALTLIVGLTASLLPWAIESAGHRALCPDDTLDGAESL